MKTRPQKDSLGKKEAAAHPLQGTIKDITPETQRLQIITIAVKEGSTTMTTMIKERIDLTAPQIADIDHLIIDGMITTQESSLYISSVGDNRLPGQGLRLEESKGKDKN